MGEIYLLAVLNLKMAWNPAPIRDPDKTNLEISDMVLLRNQTPKDTFDSKYKPSFRIWKKISDKAFYVQDNLGKIKRVSIQHLQVLHPTEKVLTKPPYIYSFGWATKYINHPNLMPDLSNTIKEKSDLHHKYMHQKENTE